MCVMCGRGLHGAGVQVHVAGGQGRPIVEPIEHQQIAAGATLSEIIPLTTMTELGACKRRKLEHALVARDDHVDRLVDRHDAALHNLDDETRQHLHAMEQQALSENTKKAYTSDMRCYAAFLQKAFPGIEALTSSYVHCLAYLDA